MATAAPTWHEYTHGLASAAQQVLGYVKPDRVMVTNKVVCERHTTRGTTRSLSAICRHFREGVEASIAPGNCCVHACSPWTRVW